MPVNNSSGRQEVQSSVCSSAWHEGKHLKVQKACIISNDKDTLLDTCCFSTAQDSMAQHSIAQHSTAQQAPAPDSESAA